MALGRRKRERQAELFVATDGLARSPGHVFYRKLNELLAAEGFDTWVEELCRSRYADGIGRRSIPPGVYFRMLLVGYFEGLASQRGIAWRCADSLSLREFLGIPLTDRTPDHSSLTVIRQRLDLETHSQVFTWVLALASRRKLFTGTAVGVDSTMLEANAAMRSIVRHETGEDWREFLKRLMVEQGVANQDDDISDDELRRFDRSREGKKVSNEEWKSPVDPDSRIMRMKDGTTHLAYKAEHVVDLKSGLLLAAEITSGDRGDTQTVEDSVHAAQAHLNEAQTEREIRDVVADCGYHAADLLTGLAEHTVYRTYFAERPRRGRSSWKKKSTETRQAVLTNRRRVRGARGKKLLKLRGEKVERSFAHVCETGAGRRSWLRGLKQVRMRYLLQAAAHNLGVVLRLLFGVGTPRSLQGGLSAVLTLFGLLQTAWMMLENLQIDPRAASPRETHFDDRRPLACWT